MRVTNRHADQSAVFGGCLFVIMLLADVVHARELPPLTHSRCHALAVNLGFRPEPTSEYDQAVVRIGREVLEMDWNGYLENVVELDGTPEDVRSRLEREQFTASQCEALIGVSPR